MAIKIAILLIATTLASSTAQILSRNPLQHLISPGNSENIIQLLRTASANRCPSKAPTAYDLPGNARIISLPGNARIVASDLPGNARIVASDSSANYPRIITKEHTSSVARESVNDCNARVVNQVVRERDLNFADSLVIPKEIFQSLAMAVAKEPAKACEPPAYNPYLPVASPVSASSPLNMPPPIQSRGHFLRKIPIPPPSL